MTSLYASRDPSFTCQGHSMTKPAHIPQEDAQALEALRVTQSVCARAERLEAAAPALLMALQRLLPNVLHTRETFAASPASHSAKKLILEMLDDDIKFAQEAIAQVINP